MAARKISNDLKGGTTILRNAFLSVQVFQSQRLVLLTRSDQAFETVKEVDQCTAELGRVLPGEARSASRIVVDMRLAPMRVSPFLDPAFERFRRETERGFARGAVITGTPLGRIRAGRLGTLTQTPLSVVGSMEEALAFLDKAADAEAD